MLKKTRSMQLMAPIESLTGKFALQRETCASRASVNSGAKLRHKYFGARITTGYYKHLGGTLSKTSFYLRKNGRYNLLTAGERTYQTLFGNAMKQAALDVKNVSKIQFIKSLYDAGTIVHGADPRSYTLGGWVRAAYLSFYKYEEGSGAIDWEHVSA